MVAVSDFSGLAISIWALASAPAMAPIVSLQRCITGLYFMELKTDGAGFGAFGPHAMANGFPGVLRHQLLQLGLGRVMIEIGPPGPAKHPGEFRPGIGRTHIDDPDSLDPRPRRLDIEQMRCLAGLHAAPELLLGGQ